MMASVVPIILLTALHLEGEIEEVKKRWRRWR
jgi:hypothetical protein